MIRRIRPGAFARHLDDLAEILVACVRGGASVNFMLPFGPAEARAFWGSLAPRIEAGHIVLLGAETDGRLIGTVQLQLAMQPNQTHRADLAKLLVHPDARGRGIAAALIAAIEAEAASLGRTLITLDTITGSTADRLYRRLGYVAAGAIPDYARMPDGPLAETTLFYKRLAGA